LACLLQTPPVLLSSRTGCEGLQGCAQPDTAASSRSSHCKVSSRRLQVSTGCTLALWCTDNPRCTVHLLCHQDRCATVWLHHHNPRAVVTTAVTTAVKVLRSQRTADLCNATDTIMPLHPRMQGGLVCRQHFFQAAVSLQRHQSHVALVPPPPRGLAPPIVRLSQLHQAYCGVPNLDSQLCSSMSVTGCDALGLLRKHTGPKIPGSVIAPDPTAPAGPAALPMLNLCALRLYFDQSAVTSK
jgi:hypothetical protein